uniref:Transmembrane protein n=1 Tax=Rhizobium leguminosarum bv. viciae TaxID=387 RepID=A0A0U3HZR4_RHILV|nr:hypothetical protein [Rhizobium leguminosarum bv. viciae]
MALVFFEWLLRLIAPPFFFLVFLLRDTLLLMGTLPEIFIAI